MGKLKTRNAIIAFSMLLIALSLQGFCIYAVNRIDVLVNSLYDFGLQFSGLWAIPYWDALYVLFALLIAGSVVIILLMARYVQFFTNKSNLRFVDYLLPFVLLGFNVSFYLVFARLQYIINHDLYYYGLQFNQEWFGTYSPISMFLLLFLGVSTVLTAITPFFSYFIGEKEFKKTKAENREIFHKPEKADLSRMISYVLIISGFIALIVSISYQSLIVVFVGLGLLLWGGLFTYVRTEEYTKKAVVEAVSNSQGDTLSNIVQELDYTGTPVILPPKYFESPKTCKVYIPKRDGELPTREQIKGFEEKTFTTHPLGMLIVPVGLELERLLEKTLGTSFSKVDLEYVQQNLSELLVEKLELVQSLDVEVEDDEVFVRIADSYLGKTGNRKEKPSASNLLYTIVSAIACVLAKVTDKCVIVARLESDESFGGKLIVYRTIGDGQK